MLGVSDDEEENNITHDDKLEVTSNDRTVNSDCNAHVVDAMHCLPTMLAH